MRSVVDVGYEISQTEDVFQSGEQRSLLSRDVARTVLAATRAFRDSAGLVFDRPREAQVAMASLVEDALGTALLLSGYLHELIRDGSGILGLVRHGGLRAPSIGVESIIFEFVSFAPSR